MALKSQPELERFFAEVGPRLDTAQTLDDELDRQLARRFNVFRYLRTDEMGFSRMIADLLDPLGDHGQGTAFLQLLTDKLCFAKGVNLRNARVQTERQIDGRRRLDISVEIDDKHCLAIENKSNFAGDQERQVEDDLVWLERYEHSLLIYLSPTGAGPSTESAEEKTIEELGTKEPRCFAIMPCGPSAFSGDGFDSLRLPFSLVDWLADCRRICDVDRLRWYLREAETYCQQRYGGNIVTDSKKSAIAEFVLGDDKNVATALAVYETWPEVAGKIKRGFLELIWKKLPDDMIGHSDWVWYWDYGDKRFESYIWAYRKRWRPYVIDGQERLTKLYMRADYKESTGWFFGVTSPSGDEVSADDRQRSNRLHEELRVLKRRRSKYWPCWEWVAEEYGDWNSLSPKLNEELRSGDGEIVKYFVDEFQKFAELTTPIINRVEGG